VGLETPRTSALFLMDLLSEYIFFTVSGISDYFFLYTNKKLPCNNKGVS
jgi:hypothetical protein